MEVECPTGEECPHTANSASLRVSVKRKLHKKCRSLQLGVFILT
jgi:hypothetical protein